MMIRFETFQRRLVSTLSPGKITELLKKNEINLARDALPSSIKSIECNQLASNSPIEDRLRVSSIRIPGASDPTIILGVFDGHGGGTTADLISRRLFKYIALSLHPQPQSLKISSHGELEDYLFDLHNSPPVKHDPMVNASELVSLNNYKEELVSEVSIAANLKTSFKRCDDDLSREIQENLMKPWSSQGIVHYYLSAAVSGCCALVLVIHRGIGYLASSGDCRAVLGIHDETPDHDKKNPIKKKELPNYKFNAIDLNDEHNCDNINEIRRLAASHPRTEQNTMIKHNRLLGHLMPFRAFGDFTYKWPIEIIKACGITKAFGSGVIPTHYNTPPYLIVEPDVKEIDLKHPDDNGSLSNDKKYQKCLVIASDGLWELFESSREVIETIVDHCKNASQDDTKDDYDENCATHLLRSALRSGTQQDFGMDTEELKRLYHIRLESTLTLPQSVVRNFRDDISIIMLKMQ